VSPEMGVQRGPVDSGGCSHGVPHFLFCPLLFWLSEKQTSGLGLNYGPVDTGNYQIKGTQITELGSIHQRAVDTSRGGWRPFGRGPGRRRTLLGVLATSAPPTAKVARGRVAGL
jgi:hypothetical protein